MRFKIIAIFTMVVLIMGGVGYAFTRATVSAGLTPNDNAPQALSAAMAQLKVEGLVLQRWLAKQAVDPKLREPFSAGTDQARGGQATVEANRISEIASKAPELGGIQPAMVLLVTPKGVVVGRNGSKMMRGDDLGKFYPELPKALESGINGTLVWISRERNEQMLVSFATVRGDEGQIVGGLVLGTAFNDERLTNASNAVSGSVLVAAVPTADGLDLLAKSSGADEALMAGLRGEGAKAAASRAIATNQAADVSGLPAGYSANCRPLDVYGGAQVVVFSATMPVANGVIDNLLWPAIGITILGIFLVVIFGMLLANYISRPIAELEEGLLAIMNGKGDIRFEIEHAELGGLVFRINSLLNQLLGVQEDDTDEQGRPSRAPEAKQFEEALSVDERMAESGVDAALAQRLREEPDDAYYARIFEEYIEAKRSLGDPVDHIAKEAFVGRIMSSERDMGAKHGKPVRYTVEVQGKEVMLLAVPLS